MWASTFLFFVPIFLIQDGNLGGYEKKYVRSGIRTHAHICGPERSWPLYWPKDLILESGALDHSAILTMVIR